MTAVKVIGSFNTSLGHIVILDFPENERPGLGMILKGFDNASWKITGMAMPFYSDMTEAYQDLDPPRLLYDCKVTPLDSAPKLSIGDFVTCELL